MQPRRPGFARRTFLRSLGASAALAPFLPLSRSEAEDEPAPKRLIVFCTTTGMTGRYPGNWTPMGSETDFVLSPILQPLAGGDTVHGLLIPDLVPEVVIVRGLDLASAYDSPTVGGHPRGIGALLTGTAIQEGTLFEGGGNESAGWGGGISVDQQVADAIGTETPFRSLELGVMNFGGVSHLRHVMSYRGPAEPLPVESDPMAAFDRVFGDFVAQDPAVLERIRHERQSVIDFVKADLAAATSRVGTSDLHKLDAHLDAVRSIEQRLAAEIGDGCTVPGAPGGFDPTKLPQFENVGRLQMDLAVAALSCDMTRVASIMWGVAPNGNRFEFVPGVLGEEDFHTLSHSGAADTLRQDQLQLIAQWYVRQFAYLVERLRQIPDGDGTLLDNTVVLWCTEVSNPNTHSHRDMPFVLAGGSAWQKGRFLLGGGAPHNRVMTSVCRACGLDIATFGDPVYGEGGLPGLL
jgi:hypothetical protein